MNIWGILLAVVGFVMLYIGIKGDPHQVVSAFRPAAAPTPAKK